MCIHTHTYIYIHTPCAQIHIRTRMHQAPEVDPWYQLNTHLYARVHVNVHMYINIHIYIYMHTYIFHTPTYKHTYTRTYRRSL